MNIPKQLVGKEVKRFIDLYYDERPLLNNFAKLYNQPFKPEIIVEYFKGWEISKKKDGFDIDCKPKYHISYTYGECGKSFHHYPNPFPYLIFFRELETLSDFIITALLAGIALKWKK